MDRYDALFLFISIQPTSLPTINSVIDTSRSYYETSIAGYKTNEFWGIWSLPISDICTVSSTKKPEDNNFYSIKNIQDQNLNTAWIPANNDKSNRQYFEFTFPKDYQYASAYQFQGICDLFNGYCKSLKIWRENSRVKKLLVYYNGIPLCYVKLLDTWHFQYFDISRFFINRPRGTHLYAKIEIKEGDKLRFEIVDTYQGTKYNDVAISEFLCDGATN